MYRVLSRALKMVRMRDEGETRARADALSYGTGRATSPHQPIKYSGEKAPVVCSDRWECSGTLDRACASVRCYVRSVHGRCNICLQSWSGHYQTLVILCCRNISLASWAPYLAACRPYVSRELLKRYAADIPPLRRSPVNGWSGSEDAPHCGFLALYCRSQFRTSTDGSSDKSTHFPSLRRI